MEINPNLKYNNILINELYFIYVKYYNYFMD